MKDKVILYSDKLVDLLKAIGYKETGVITTLVEDILQAASSKTLLDLLNNSPTSITDSLKKKVTGKASSYAISQEIHKHFEQYKIDSSFALNIQEYLDGILQDIKPQLAEDQRDKVNKILVGIKQIALTKSNTSESKPK